jgi:hypothetical protein
MRRGRIGSVAAIGVLVLLLAAAPAPAADGRFEIDIDCVATGCFTGDSAGFPVTIPTAGSYVLTSNLDGAAMMATKTIEIGTDGVSLDLNGFFVSAGPSSDMEGAIVISASGAEVKNGRVTGFGHGINALSGNQIRVANVRVSVLAKTGINLGPGSDSEVIDSIVSGNSSVNSKGIKLNGRGKVAGCLVATNGGGAIEAGQAALVENNVVTANGAATGIVVGTSSLVRGNIVAFNGIGIDPDLYTMIIGNNVGNNTTNIDTCGDCTLIDNRVGP